MTDSARPQGPSVTFRPAVDLPVGAFVLLTSAIGSTTGPHPFDLLRDIDPIGVVAGLVLALLLAGRRRWPYRVLVAVLAVSVVVGVSGHPYLGGVLATAFAVYQVSRTRRRTPAVLCALGAVALLQVVLASQGQVDVAKVLSGVAIVAFAAAVGDAAQTRRALIDSITERAIRAEQTREEEAARRVAEERLRIARELHDAAAHQIAVINLQTGSATVALESSRYDDVGRSLRTIQGAARSVLSEIAALVVVLRSTDDQDAADLAPVRGTADVPTLIAAFESAGLRVTGERALGPSVASGAADVVAFKVIQEALTNAQKHGSDATVELTVEVDLDELHITTRNTVPLSRLYPSLSGHGLTGMRERVASVHGAMRVESTAGLFVLDVALPLDRSTA